MNNDLESSGIKNYIYNFIFLLEFKDHNIQINTDARNVNLQVGGGNNSGNNQNNQGGNNLNGFIQQQVNIIN